jgi:UDP-N-acetylmuramate--alanine ligase
MTEGRTGQSIPQRVHLVGVGGAHMSAIARILMAWGHTVSGSDLRPSPLTERLTSEGVSVFEGHDAGNLGEAALLVTTSAAHEDNPEIVEARRRGLPVIKRAEMVARLMEGRHAVAVAGTHGKSTTSALIAFILERAGLSPTYLIGGEVPDLGGNAAAGSGRHIVVEADEFDAAFLSYYPQSAVVTNVEPDHLDIYGSLERLVETFGRFLGQVPSDGRIIGCADNQTVRRLLGLEGGPPTAPLVARYVESYALDRSAGWTVEALESKPDGSYSFRALRQGRLHGSFRTGVPGRHNVANALAAIAASHALEVPLEAVQGAVASFRGVRRRFELVGEAGGITVMDDYAHHPTEVRATLATARQRFAGRRLVCLFQPHTYSRTRYLLEGFRTCFEETDVLLIGDTYAARETPEAGMDGRQLAEAVERPRARFVATFDEAADTAAAMLRPGDVFFTIGAGDVDQVGPMVLERLRSKPARQGGGSA